MPTISNRFKRVVGGVRGFLPLGTTMRSGIDIIGHQRTCSLSPLASLLETHVGIDAEGNTQLLVMPIETEMPTLRTRRGHLQR
ncbi:hypothetical protein D9M71_719860 [compost metagenome]